MAMNENSKKVLAYLKEIGDKKVTSKDVAAALEIGQRSVDGAFTAFTRKEPALGKRVPAEIELEDGTHKQVNFLVLTEAGMAYVPDAE